MKPKLYLQIVLVVVLLGTGIIYADAMAWQVKDLVDKADIIAVVVVKQLDKKSDERMIHVEDPNRGGYSVLHNPDYDKFMDVEFLVNKILKTDSNHMDFSTLTVPALKSGVKEGVLRCPEPISFIVGARYIVFLVYEDPNQSLQSLRLISDTAGAVRLEGDKTFVKPHLLDSNPPQYPQYREFNEPELLKRVQELISKAKLAPSAELEKELAKIAAMNKGEGTDHAVLEAECLELMKDHNSPEDIGKIYAKIALIYSGKGYSSPNDIRIAKTTEYCKKALELPLDVITACEMNGRLAGSMIAWFQTLPPSKVVELRREAIVFCLNGLKIALDNNAPKEHLPPPPGVGKYDVGSNDPDYEKFTKKHEQQVAEREKWKLENNLYIQRQVLTGLGVSLYSHEPYDINELEKFARDTLKGHDDAVNEMLTKVNERIAQIAQQK